MRPQINKKPRHDVLSSWCSSQGSPWSLLSHIPVLTHNSLLSRIPVLTHNKQPALLSQYGRLLLQDYLVASDRSSCLPVVLPKHTEYTYFLNMGPGGCRIRTEASSLICTEVLYRQACLSLCNPRLWDILEMSGTW